MLMFKISIISLVIFAIAVVRVITNKVLGFKSTSLFQVTKQDIRDLVCILEGIVITVAGLWAIH